MFTKKIEEVKKQALSLFMKNKQNQQQKVFEKANQYKRLAVSCAINSHTQTSKQKWKK